LSAVSSALSSGRQLGQLGCRGRGHIPYTLGGIPSGGTVTVRIVVRAPQEAGTITNSAYVATTASDPNLSNERDGLATMVIDR
jgi:hypothetical protein